MRLWASGGLARRGARARGVAAGAGRWVERAPVGVAGAHLAGISIVYMRKSSALFRIYMRAAIAILLLATTADALVVAGLEVPHARLSPASRALDEHKVVGRDCDHKLRGIALDGSDLRSAAGTRS